MHDESEHGEMTPEMFEHATKPRNLGQLDRADGMAETSNPCGDTLLVTLRVRDGVITALRYAPRSCVTTLACISAASTMAEGRTPVAARRTVQPEAIDAAVGGLPDDHKHCADLAARAIWAAIDDFFVNDREPWKKLYR